MAAHNVKGGYVRAARLSKERRYEIAVKAAKTRWRRYRKALKLALKGAA